jgi:hypothetical protein
MRKSLWIIAALFAVISAPTVLLADDITYNVNQTEGIFAVSGTVTTDGAIGTLGNTDIVAWDLTLNSFPAILLDTNNSTAEVIGSALTATATELTFDFTFGGTSNSGLIFHDPSYVSWWDVVSQPPYAGYEAIAEFNGLSTEQYTYTAGTQVVASGGVSTPEPSTSGLMLSGVGLLGLMMVMRKRFIPQTVSH